MNGYQQRLMELIVELINTGYEVVLGKKYFSIKETYKSVVRDKWEDKEVYSCMGGIEYFSEGGARILVNTLLELRGTLLPEQPTKVKEKVGE